MLTKGAVWDLPTRVFHWGLALSVFLSMLIVYGKKYLAIHVVFGALSFALIVGRLAWGFVGTRYVKFSSFLKGMNDIKSEFSLFKNEKATHTVGHPAVAGWVMLLLMGCAFCVGVSGVWLWLFTDAASKESWLHIHEIFANTLLAITFIHIQGVILHIFLHRDGIVQGMIDGKRPAHKHERIGGLSLFQKSVAILWFGCSAVAALAAIRFI